jgi:hypothetical protein
MLLSRFVILKRMTGALAPFSSKLKPSFCKIITKKLSLSLLRFSGQSDILEEGESIPKECRSAECRGSKKLAPFSGDFSVEQNSSEFAQFLRIKRQSSSQPAKKRECSATTE